MVLSAVMTDRAVLEETRPNAHAVAGKEHAAARTRLGAAILRESAVLTRLRRIEDELPRVHQRWLDAMSVLEEATVQLEVARETEPHRLALVAIGDIPEGSNPVAQAEALHEAAKWATDSALRLEEALKRERD